MIRLASWFALLWMGVGCGVIGKDDPAQTRMSEQPKVAHAVLAPSKAATTQPTMNNVRGKVTFTQVADGVAVDAEITGLPPNSKHGFHIHEKGDLSSDDLMSTGPHWDPHATHRHGGPSTQPVHAGDMGNLITDGTGTARMRITLKGISIDDPHTGVVGRSVIVHAQADDLSSQPAGNAGARVAGGLIKPGN
ncbi:MAG: superoxide dismutase family protein [Phycisphaerae bacterium]|nr:superoxide dismutase family protein [Phycisphaerae bacterium]